VLPNLARAGDWQPINPADLTMTELPEAPGADAVLLYHERITDDNEQFDAEYFRIKIFSDAGKRYADVQIPYFRSSQQVKGIKARTIHPDGKVIDFSGQVYDKLVEKTHGYKVWAKTFTLPDVQTGSIIEYKFDSHHAGVVFDTTWRLQADLFTRHLLFKM